MWLLCNNISPFRQLFVWKSRALSSDVEIFARRNNRGRSHMKQLSEIKLTKIFRWNSSFTYFFYIFRQNFCIAKRTKEWKKRIKLARAARRKISSPTCLTLNNIIPRATPGKMYELFPCPGLKIFPFSSTFGNGLPLANNTRPCINELE